MALSTPPTKGNTMMTESDFEFMSRTGETRNSYAAKHMYDPPADKPDITARPWYTGEIATTPDDIATLAGTLWDIGEVDYVGDVHAADYLSRMLTAASETALWMASHYDDQEGTGEYQEDIDEVRFGWAPAYEEALTPEARDELTEDVAGFVRNAWPYLAADEITPELAGHNFMLSRNGAGTGFWDRGYRHGRALHDLADPFGAYGLEVDGHGDDAHVASHHN
jgi:hypothetical protein